MTDSVITREAGDLRRALRAARVGGVVSTLSLLVLLGILTYFVYTLDQRVGELEAELATVGLRVSGLETDVTSLASELYTVGMLARNADNYAHSHYSDLRLKREVAAYHSDIQTLIELRPVSFEWDRDTYPALGLPEGQRLGLIAQEVEALYPALVSTNAAGFKVIDYGGLTAVLVDALQSQQTTIDRLVGENAALSDRLSQLENGPASDSR